MVVRCTDHRLLIGIVISIRNSCCNHRHLSVNHLARWKILLCYLAEGFAREFIRAHSMLIFAIHSILESACICI